MFNRSNNQSIRFNTATLVDHTRRVFMFTFKWNLMFPFITWKWTLRKDPPCVVAEHKWQYKNKHLIIRPVEHFCIKHAVSENSKTRVPKVQVMQGQTHLMQISPLLFVRPLEPTVCINVCRGHALSNFNALCFWHPNLTLVKYTLLKYELKQYRS